MLTGVTANREEAERYPVPRVALHRLGRRPGRTRSAERRLSPAAARASARAPRPPGSVVSMKSVSTSRNRCGSSICGKWPASGRPRAGSRAPARGRRAPCATGMMRVALAPDQHEWDVLGQVEAVAGVDALAARLDDRAQGVHERLARLAVIERGVAAGHLLDVGARAQSQAVEKAAHGAAGVEDPAAGQQRQHPLRSGQRGCSQERADLAAQAAAVHQHQPLAALRELVGQLHRDAAAERVPDECGAVVAQRHEHVPHAAGVRAERVVAARLGGLAVPDQVGSDHRERWWPGRASPCPRWPRSR